MQLHINKIEIENVIHLSAKERYKYFIKKVADTSYIWGLFEDGWAVSGDEEGNLSLPLWPAKEYAELCIDGQWANYNAKSINIHEFIDEYLDNIKDKNYNLAVFYTPNNLGVEVLPNVFLENIKEELKKIE